MHVHVHVIIYSELFEVWGAGDFPPLKLRFLSLNFLKLIIIIHVQTVLNYGKLPLCPPPPGKLGIFKSLIIHFMSTVLCNISLTVWAFGSSHIR